VTTADITLTHASVNSGTAVNMSAIDVNIQYERMTKADPVEGKNDIVEVDLGGFGENPVIFVSGIIEVTDLPNNTITQAFLLDFKQATSAITMEIIGGSYSGSPSNNQRIRGRPTGGYSLGGTLTSTLSVVLRRFSIRLASDENLGAVWRYQAEFVETA